MYVLLQKLTGDDSSTLNVEQVAVLRFLADEKYHGENLLWVSRTGAGKTTLYDVVHTVVHVQLSFFRVSSFASF